MKRQRIINIVSYVGMIFFLLLIGLTILFIALPIIALIWRNIQSEAWTIPLDDRVPTAIEFSLRTTGISLSFIILGGTPLAYMLARWQFIGKRLISVLVDLPIVLPPAVAGLGLLVAFGRKGLLGPTLDILGIRIVFTSTAVVLAQIFVALPFYVRIAQSGFQQIDPEVENAARVDGANAVQRFIYVIFPMARRALFSGAIVSWARALGEFGATIFFAGNLLGKPQTMPLLIYSAFEIDIDIATWIALIFIGVSTSVLVFSRLLEPTSNSLFD